jgi:hypothetical protein
VSGDGFHLSDPGNGVWFKVFPDRDLQIKIAWPEKQSGNGWLVLDRNHNGKIDDFSEFFGDLTPQPSPPHGQPRNGFLALRVYDQPENGGNGDGVISAQDAIYDQLRVWIDANHDGVSQPDELHTLASLGIAAISLDYTYSKLTDQYGNVFRYRSTLVDDNGGESDKTIYDVYLILGVSRSLTSAGEWKMKSRGRLDLH